MAFKTLKKTESMQSKKTNPKQLMQSKKINPKQLMQPKKLKVGKEYLITIKRADPFIPTFAYVHKTKAKVVDWFNGGLRFWFDDAYGQECFSPIDSVIAVEDL